MLTEKMNPDDIEKEEYKDKENIIVKQEPAFDENNKKLLKEDIVEITLWIPDIVDEYPDMVNEGWTLNNVISFAKEFKLNLTVYDSTTNKIPETEYEKYKDIKVITQSKPVGYTIIEGFNFNVNINTQYETKKEENNQEEVNQEQTTQTQ